MDDEGFFSLMEESGWVRKEDVEAELHALRSENGRLRAEIAAHKKSLAAKRQPRKRPRGVNNG